jgi:chorismate synthase
MGSNSFGTIFRITSWGESHGKAMGVVIDGCPSGVAISEEDIAMELKKRRPGNNDYTSSRKEDDIPHILSGVFEGVTTGSPISIIVYNKDVQSRAYDEIKDIFRPSHADMTYHSKYGVRDYRGGGRASARETIASVAAGAIAKKILRHYNIDVVAYTNAISSITADTDNMNFDVIKQKKDSSSIFCPDAIATTQMISLLKDAKIKGDSLGGVVGFQVEGQIRDFGDPIYDKIDAKLSFALMTIPAAKAVEIGSGFASCLSRGSDYNDAIIMEGEEVRTATNRCGGVMGGIANGMPITGRVVFKPTPSIKKPQDTVNIKKKCNQTVTLSNKFRFDPSVVVRAVAVVESMISLVLVDSLLMDRSSVL